MDNPSPVSSVDSFQKPNTKFVIFGIIIAIIYTVPLVAYLITVVPLTVLFVSVPFANEGNLQIISGVVFVIAVSISFIIVGVTAFLSGRAAYRSANESGNIGNALIATAVSFIVCFIGVFVFSVLGILILGLLYEPFATSDQYMIGVFPVGLAVGILVAYIVAVISGAVTHRILTRRYAKQKNHIPSGGSN